MISNIISLSYDLCVIYFSLTQFKYVFILENQNIKSVLNLTYHLFLPLNPKAYLRLAYIANGYNSSLNLHPIYMINGI